MSNLTDPRVLLALERTLLAWSRTSLALIAFGFILERSTLLGEIFQPEQYAQKIFASKLFAILIIIAGIMLSIWSVRQYRAALKSLTAQEMIEGYRTDLPVYLGLFNVLCGVMLLITFFI